MRDAAERHIAVEQLLPEGAYRKQRGLVCTQDLPAWSSDIIGDDVQKERMLMIL